MINRKNIFSIIFSFSIFFNATLLKSACISNPSALAQITASVCYACMLPISIAGVQVAQGIMPDPAGSVGNPICVCSDPFPRVGIPVSFYEPSRLIEVVSDPYCFPSFSVPAPPQPTLHGGKHNGNGNNETSNFRQAHYMIFPVYSLLEIVTDFACLEIGGADIAYITEVDPLWQNDTLTAFIQPEALLFANPVSNLACVADSVSSLVYFPLDPLFWCMGSWGNSYPMTGSQNNTGSFMQDMAGIAGRMIYKLHRELVLWGSWGQAGLCGYYPMPIWRKSAYRLQPIYPIPHFIGISIGQSGNVWSFSKRTPVTGDNYSFLLFKKRDCCVF